MVNNKDERTVETLKALPLYIQEFLTQRPASIRSQDYLFAGVAVGECPVCGRFNTRQGNETPLRDSTLGICMNCYRITCMECGEILRKGQTVCDHWKVCRECNPDWIKSCNIPIWNCSIIEEWKSKRK